MPNMRPRFGDRVLMVGITWAVVAFIALKFGPATAMLISLIPLGMAAKAAWRAHQTGAANTMEHLMKRQVTVIAMLIAATLFAATVWTLRDRVPLWIIPFEIGLLLHYWLLSLK